MFIINIEITCSFDQYRFKKSLENYHLAVSYFGNSERCFTTFFGFDPKSPTCGSMDA